MYWFTPTPDVRAEWQRCILEDLPESVRDTARRFESWTMYRLKTTGQVCAVVSFFEPDDAQGTLLRVYAEHPGLGPFSGVNVVGIDPDDLEPWPDSEPFERPTLTVSYMDEGGHIATLPNSAPRDSDGDGTITVRVGPVVFVRDRVGRG